jgi:hypothetical protein
MHDPLRGGRNPNHVSRYRSGHNARGIPGARICRQDRASIDEFKSRKIDLQHSQCRFSRRSTEDCWCCRAVWIFLSHPGPPVPRWPLSIIFPHERGERRTVPRHKLLKAGKIILGKRASMIDCTVRNFSSTGAAVWLPNAAVLPPKFDLLFDNAIQHCIVVWRQADRMGVKFRSAP